MPQFTPITRESHAGKNWRRPPNFAFAAGEAVVPLVGVELAHAVVTMPIAFTAEADRYRLVALLSLVPGKNLFVAPDGKWLGGYIPAFFRGYPFRLWRQEGSETAVLCIDQDSKLLMEADGTGEDFFDGEGKLSS